MKRIQIRFLKPAAYREDGIYLEFGVPQDVLLTRFLSQSLRRTTAQLVFFVQGFGIIDCSSILFLCLPTTRTIIQKFSSLFRICSRFFHNKLDICNCTLFVIKKLTFSN